ncbi:hypothetical protein Pyn_10601 [Prunus yedoensis var. nudiflora]|uniref:Uncharacterized protein n=1 Tax=Prunus yedoensis var. nudiflora TaxID=2094558 RepID=A0A314YPU9_PRUYE|nr:hypothetical protein Pyn_10601 [Prunus yedoensis var. nudiflora]
MSEGRCMVNIVLTLLRWIGKICCHPEWSSKGMMDSQSSIPKCYWSPPATETGTMVLQIQSDHKSLPAGEGHKTTIVKSAWIYK